MSKDKQDPVENPLLHIDSLGEDPVNTSRRRLTGAGLGMSAIFTLASRPVLAADCLTPSAAASGNVSQHGTLPICSGFTAATWAGIDAKDYPSSGSNPGIGSLIFNTGNGNPKFKDVFRNGANATWGSSDKLHDVLNAADGGSPKPNPISKEFAATLLSIRKGGLIPPSVMDEGRLINMWNEWVGDGIFNPQAGIDWGAAQIVMYLRGLQS